MLVTLDELKLYLRLDATDTTEDSLLTSLNATAEEYLKNATGFTFSTDVPEMAKMIIKLLVAHWYENREVVSSSYNNEKVHFTVESLINQLTYTHEETIV